MSNPTPRSSSMVKLFVHVDELKGGPEQVPLTILAEPTWKMRRVWASLTQTYDQYLADYPAFSQAFTISSWGAFPPKPEFNLDDLVSDVLQTSKGILGPHIYATIESVEKGKEAGTSPETSKRPTALTVNAGSRKRKLNDSAVAALQKRSSEHESNTMRTSAGTLKRPTKIASQGAVSASHKNAPRRNLYDVGDDNESDTGHDEELQNQALKQKRVRTDAGPRHELHSTPLPHRVSRMKPTITQTPTVAHSPSSSPSHAPVVLDQPAIARGVWTTEENELMLTEIIANGADTPTATLRDTLFPGRSTEGIRKRRKRIQNERAQEIIRRQRAPAMSKTKAPTSSKKEAPPISKTKAHPSSRTKTPRPPVAQQRRESSTCVPVEAVDDPSQQKLEIRPGGAVRLKSKGDDGYMTPPKSSVPLLKKNNTDSREPDALEADIPEESGSDIPFDAEDEPQGSSCSTQGGSQIEISTSFSKFIQAAKAAAASDERGTKTFELQNDMTPSNPKAPGSSSRHSTWNDSFERRPSPRVVIKKKLALPLVVSKTLGSSTPYRTTTITPRVEYKKSSTTNRGSPSWPEDTPIAKSALASAEARKVALLSSSAKSAILLHRSPALKLGEEEGSHIDRRQSEKADDPKDFDRRWPGQTPRTLKFKDRTPRSLSRSIVKSALAIRESDASSESSSSGSNCSDSADGESDVDIKVDTKINGNTQAKVDTAVNSISESDASERDGSDSFDLEDEADVNVIINSSSSVLIHESDADSSNSENSLEDEFANVTQSQLKTIKGSVADDQADQALQLGVEELQSRNPGMDEDDYLADQQLRSDAGLLDIVEEHLPDALPIIDEVESSPMSRDLRENSVVSEECYSSTSSGSEAKVDAEVAEETFAIREKIGIRESGEEGAEGSEDENSAGAADGGDSEVEEDRDNNSKEDDDETSNTTVSSTSALKKQSATAIDKEPSIVTNLKIEVMRDASEDEILESSASKEDIEGGYDSDDDDEDEVTLDNPVSALTTEEYIKLMTSVPRKMSMAAVDNETPSVEDDIMHDAANSDKRAKPHWHQMIDKEMQVQEERDESYVAFHTQMLYMGDSLSGKMAKLFY